MSNRYRNFFLLFGICAIGIMIWQFPEGWETIRQNRIRVLRYLPGVVGTWLFV